jgi:hypothetical protein
MRMTITNLSIADVSGTLNVGGTISMNTSGNTETITMDFVLSGTGQSAKFENVVLVTTNDGSVSQLLLSESLGGRFYDSTEGYVDVSTTNPLLYSPAGSINPSSGGPVIFTGANNSKIRMTPVDSVNVTIDVDADGDGVYEFSQTVPWSSI